MMWYQCLIYKSVVLIVKTPGLLHKFKRDKLNDSLTDSEWWQSQVR